jgi:hypothetical protein
MLIMSADVRAGSCADKKCRSIIRTTKISIQSYCHVIRSSIFTGKSSSTYLMFHSLGQNMLVEAACEVALQQLIVVDRLGDHSPHKLEVVQVVGINVGEVVDCVGYPGILQQIN